MVQRFLIVIHVEIDHTQPIVSLGVILSLDNPGISINRFLLDPIVGGVVQLKK